MVTGEPLLVDFPVGPEHQQPVFVLPQIDLVLDVHQFLRRFDVGTTAMGHTRFLRLWLDGWGRHFLKIGAEIGADWIVAVHYELGAFSCGNSNFLASDGHLQGGSIWAPIRTDPYFLGTYVLTRGQFGHLGGFF